MTRTTAHVEGSTLILARNDASPIAVDTPAWFAWLEHASTFAFTSPSGHFTARKERQARGEYWKAYRTSHGTLHRVYLGKTQALTLDRLNRAATTLGTTSGSASALLPNLIATKLFGPPVRANLVVRPRLFERLQTGLRGKLTLIAAPAGFGKTTLLSAWRATAAGSALPCGWVSLDSADNDPLRFWSYVITALNTLVPGVGTTALALLQSPQPPPIEAILTVLLNDITAAPGHFALVLDDYHVIDARSIDDALAFLLEHLPPHMHLVITTREDPQLPLARLRARDQLTELRDTDLRFTSSEAAAFLREVMGLNLSAEDIDALEARTEGWIVGLQLAALSLQGRQDATSFIASFTGSSRFIIDYLAEEVLERQPEAVRSFLLRTSILERMCAPLCDAVLNVNNEAAPLAGSPQRISSQAMLEKLERSNLFIVPLDNERRWYRYHHLFADLLRQRLHQSSTSSPGDEGSGVDELHHRASQWYEDNGLEIEAFHHAAAANDVARAERLIEGAGVPLHFRGAGAPVLHWLHSLPKTALDARPSLWVTYASVSMMTGQHTVVEEKLQAAEVALHGTEMDDKTRDLLGRIASMRATVAVIQHDVPTLLAQSRRALEFLHPNNLPLRTAATYTLGYAYQLQGNRAAASRAYAEVIAASTSFGTSIYTTAATLSLGQLQEADNQLHLAVETYRRVLLLAGVPPRPIASNAHLGLARISYQWNDLDTAEEHAHQCLQLTRQMERVDTVALHGVFLARLRLSQGDAASASTLLDEAEAFVRQHHFVFRMPDVAAAQVLVLLCQGHLVAAAHLAETHQLPISQARVHLAQGHPATALAVLEPVRQQAEAKGWADERLTVMLLQAVAHHACGETDAAVQLLGEVLALSQPGGFVRLFVDEGVPMARLLYEALARGVEPTFIRRLLAAFGVAESEQLMASPASSSPSSLVEPLSEREREVLQLIAEGLTNQDVAARLYLSVHTVKVHARNIYAKLEVTNRTQAVARGKALGIVPQP